MNPGREFDALIAEKVMGLEPWPEQDPRWKCKAFKARFVPSGQEAKPCLPPEYSIDIAAAWEVVEKLVELKYYVQISYGKNGAHELKEVFCTIKGFLHGKDNIFDNYIIFSETAKTASHAICLVALKAVGEK